MTNILQDPDTNEMPVVVEGKIDAARIYDASGDRQRASWECDVPGTDHWTVYNPARTGLPYRDSDMEKTYPLVDVQLWTSQNPPEGGVKWCLGVNEFNRAQGNAGFEVMCRRLGIEPVQLTQDQIVPQGINGIRCLGYVDENGTCFPSRRGIENNIRILAQHCGEGLQADHLLPSADKAGDSAQALTVPQDAENGLRPFQDKRLCEKGTPAQRQFCEHLLPLLGKAMTSLRELANPEPEQVSDASSMGMLTSAATRRGRHG